MAQCSSRRHVDAATDLAETSYTPDIYGYFILCIFPIEAMFFFAVGLFAERVPRYWPALGLAISFLMFLGVIIFLRSLRLELTGKGVAYRTIFQGTRYLEYSEILDAYLIDHKRRRSFARWTMILVPNPESVKRTIKIPLTLFPTAARSDLSRLLNPSCLPSSGYWRRPGAG
jgi:hypothetical protein